jgi:aminopeptidase-like protein
MSLRAPLDPAALGRDLHRVVRDLYPICRSITGDGVRQTLARIGKDVPLEIHEVPTGTPVFDWTVPKEWNIRGASIRDEQGRSVLDFRDSNLHVVGYSVPWSAGCRWRS